VEEPLMRTNRRNFVKGLLARAASLGVVNRIPDWDPGDTYDDQELDTRFTEEHALDLDKENERILQDLKYQDYDPLPLIKLFYYRTECERCDVDKWIKVYAYEDEFPDYVERDSVCVLCRHEERNERFYPDL
jgi:hypothetical protein